LSSSQVTASCLCGCKSPRLQVIRLRVIFVVAICSRGWRSCRRARERRAGGLGSEYQQESWGWHWRWWLALASWWPTRVLMRVRR